MNNQNAEKLLRAIEEREKVYRERLNRLGFEDEQTQSAFSELMALEDEFEAVFGRNAYILMRNFEK